MKYAIYGLLGIAAFGAVTWGLLEYSGLMATRTESIRTTIFEESQAYTHGKRTDLNRLYLEYQKADAAGKVGISNAVRDMFAAVDTTEYPTHLQTFLSQTGAK